MEINFEDKSVVVIGGTSGINLGIAEKFAQSGAKLAVASRSEKKVDDAVNLLSKHKHNAIGHAGDVRDYKVVEEIFKKFNEQHGEIDVLISGAAGNFPAPAMGISSNGFKAVVDIDLLGTFHVMRSAYPYLKKPGASVINISAPQAYIPLEFQIHVCAAKSGVDMVTKVLAMEWGKEGIRVNSISPGPILDTEGMKRLAPTEEILNATTESVPLKRIGTKIDIANTAMFLSSEHASFISGTVIPVDGGWSLGGASSLTSEMKKLFQI
ncbi:MAG: short-chain dehydrogenase [Rhodospirillaceae bacterium]|nr:short-chain dehydrogenase [Rhodospirillaceae bacterium]|tara:strand:- start:4132 stop:4932 length:801 start_codon:yes stop_codon:yes gene_type:complete